MHRLRVFALVVTLPLIEAAALMQSGSWCYLCHQEADDVCREGRCLDVEVENSIDHEAFQHAPANVDWGGGD